MKNIFLLCLIGLFGLSVSAQTTQKIKDLEKQRNELQQQIAESETLLRSTRKDVKSQLDNLALINGQIDSHLLEEFFQSWRNLTPCFHPLSTQHWVRDAAVSSDISSAR